MKVVFTPDGRESHVEKGTSILEAARKAGIRIESDCGGMGRCGKCKVVVPRGVEPLTARERDYLSPHEIENNIRLACQTVVSGRTFVHLPGTSSGKERILEEGISRPVALKPAVSKRFLDIKQTQLKQAIAVDEIVSHRLHRRSSRPAIGFSGLKALPGMLSMDPSGITAVIEGDEVLGFEPGDTTKRLFGLAVDVGTTTIVGYLFDLTCGVLCGVHSDLNAQFIYGSDVISRIEHAVTSSTGLTQLHDAVTDTVNRIMENLCAVSGISSDDVYCLVLVGNTSMHHLFWGLSPRFLSRFPYNPATVRTLSVSARHLSIRMNPLGRIISLPLVSGFIGSDTVGVVLSTGLHKSKTPKLAIDIGTNGEIVLTDGKSLTACSCAAGPAFEGAHIECGMRGASGAIDRVDFENDEIRCRVIDGVPPTGICGSGLVDAVAGLLKAGIISGDGRMKNRNELTRSSHRDRIRRHRYNRFSLTGKKAAKGEVVITQKDIRELQLAKGAMMAGIQILLDRRGISKEAVREVFLAGAFGNYIRPENAVAIGLLPDFKNAKITPVGNAAGSGAKMALLCANAVKQAEKIAARIEYVEIAKRTDFQEKFLNGMLFPS